MKPRNSPPREISIRALIIKLEWSDVRSWALYLTV